jgi:hypothetical protein
MYLMILQMVRKQEGAMLRYTNIWGALITLHMNHSVFDRYISVRASLSTTSFHLISKLHTLSFRDQNFTKRI